MKTACVTAAALLIAGPALAEQPFAGIWAAEPDWCAHADRIGAHDPAPIAITDSQLKGYESSCDIVDVRQGPDAGQWWEVTLSCQAEGETFEETQLMMLADPDTLWIFYGLDAPVRFARCAA